MEKRLPLLIASILSVLLHTDPFACPKYDRDSQYGGWKSWGDCQNTRAKVLIRDSKAPVTFAGTKTCTVDSGLWYDPYSDETFHLASEVQIEHVIPLSEAHKSGSWAWTLEKRKAFTNFLDSSYHLLPIKGSVNSSKGDKDPAEWMPPNEDYWHQYALNWVKIKTHWNLKANREELTFLRSLLKDDMEVPYPEEALEDYCTDTSTVAVRQWVIAKKEEIPLIITYPMDLLGRSLRPHDAIYPLNLKTSHSRVRKSASR